MHKISSPLNRIVVASMLLLSAMVFAQGSQNVPLLVQINDYPSAGYNDCWGYVGPDGREYALLGVENGTSIIDITDTDNATEIEFISSSDILWKDIKTYQHYAYVVTDLIGNGMQIIDLSDLPNSATLVNTYTGFQTSHNIYIDRNNGVLYAQGGQGIRVLSLDNPENPVEVSQFGINSHDVYVQDNRAFVSEGNNGTYGIFDVSDPNNPSLLQRITVPAAGYCHNAWPTQNGQYLMTTEETPGKTIKMWDISDLNNITLASEYIGPNNFAHNTHIKGDYAYVSHYGSGLRIVDISDPTDMVEVGYYDTSSDWGAYPFFDSGKILISDMDDGLYVVFFDGAVVNPVGIENETELPQTFYLSRNYPNPFNPTTMIDYRLSKASHVTLIIYNAAGQKVRTLVSDNLGAGTYQAEWDGRNDAGAFVSSGMYLYRFQADNFSQIHKMIFLK